MKAKLAGAWMYRVITALSLALTFASSDVVAADVARNLKRIELNLGVNYVHLLGPESNDVIVMFNPMYGTVYSPYVIIPLTRSNDEDKNQLMPIAFPRKDSYNEFENTDNIVVLVDGHSCFTQDSSFYISDNDGKYNTYYVRANRSDPFGDSTVKIEKFILKKQNISEIIFGEKLHMYSFFRFGKPLVLSNSSLCEFKDLEMVEKKYLEQPE